jgi:FAD/FMN-containing dehydrogenase
MDLIRRLGAVVGPEHVLTDPAVTVSYAVDWTGRFRGSAAAVVRPRSTEEVAGVLAVCNEAEAAVVPQGGNTGLVGGGVPLAGEIVLSLRRLDEIGPVDTLAGQVTAGAGVTLAGLQARAAAAGWAFGVDLAARDSATVGGMVATNAGGNRMMRYGPMRAQVLGVEAVLADGRVVSHLGGLAKDNTGYDLAGLVTGSEGTLAVVTRVRLRLVPRFEHRVVALLAVGSVATAVEATTSLRREVPSLEAAELFLAEGLALVCRVFGLPRPFAAEHAAYLLVECADHRDPEPELARAVGRLGPLVLDAAVATEPARRAALWRYREAHTEAIATLGVAHKLDVALAPGSLPAFVAEVPAVVARAAPGATTFLFGHVGDGNVHVNVVGAGDGDEVDAAVLGLVADMGGSISAEHGIGRAKRRWLHLNRSPVEIDVFAAIKRALDPRGILNPGVLLPPR